MTTMTIELERQDIAEEIKALISKMKGVFSVSISEQASAKIKTTDSLQAEIQKQNRLIAQGKMQKAERSIREFTAEEQCAFDSALSLEEVFSRLETKHIS